MISRRHILKAILGSAALGTAGIGVALHASEGPENIPELRTGKSRVTLWSWDLAGPASLVNAKHYFLRFELGLLGVQYDLHGLAINRRNKIAQAMGSPETEDIRVVAKQSYLPGASNLPWVMNDGEDYSSMKPKPVHVLHETDNLKEALTLYLKALKAGREINAAHIPYHAVELKQPITNSNAVAQTLCDQCGFTLPDKLSGVAPGLGLNLLQLKNLKAADTEKFASSQSGMTRLGAEISEILHKLEMWDDTAEGPLIVWEESGLALTLGYAGALSEKSYPVNPTLLEYMWACENFEDGDFNTTTYESFVKLKNNIIRGHADIKMNYGIDMPFPQNFDLDLEAELRKFLNLRPAPGPV